MYRKQRVYNLNHKLMTHTCISRKCNWKNVNKRKIQLNFLANNYLRVCFCPQLSNSTLFSWSTR